MLKPVSAALTAVLLLTAPLPLALAQAPAPISADPAAVEGGAFVVEPVHTRVVFSVSHMGFTTWYGEFSRASGALILDTNTLEKSNVEIHLPTSSVATGNAKLDGELKSDQWLDAGKNPTITFKSTKLTRTGAATGKLEGELTLHGVTKPITLDVKFNAAGTNPLDKKYTVGFDATGSIKRSDFGVKTYIPLIGDDVGIIISAAFERK